MFEYIINSFLTVDMIGQEGKFALFGAENCRNVNEKDFDKEISY